MLIEFNPNKLSPDDKDWIEIVSEKYDDFMIDWLAAYKRGELLGEDLIKVAKKMAIFKTDDSILQKMKQAIDEMENDKTIKTVTCLICKKSSPGYDVWSDPHETQKAVCQDCVEEAGTRGIDCSKWILSVAALQIDEMIELAKTTDALFDEVAVLFRLDKDEEAIEVLDRILKIAPKNRKALYYKGITLSKMENDIEAFEAYDQMLEIDSKDQDALFYKGLTFFKSDKNVEALEMFDAALDTDQEISQALLYKGFTLAKLNRDVEAIETFDKLLTTESENPDFLNQRGISLCKLGRYQEGIEMYNGILAIYPDDPRALENKKYAQELLEADGK